LVYHKFNIFSAIFSRIWKTNENLENSANIGTVLHIPNLKSEPFPKWEFGFIDNLKSSINLKEFDKSVWSE
jgi:hypothetical protein